MKTTVLDYRKLRKEYKRKRELDRIVDRKLQAKKSAETERPKLENLLSLF